MCIRCVLESLLYNFAKVNAVFFTRAKLEGLVKARTAPQINAKDNYLCQVWIETSGTFLTTEFHVRW